MGLAAPRKRRKIGEDPNNTTWANSTTGFGHKIMAAQGWTPGTYLGAENAAHASHYSAANASHIRVLLKDDNLGIGAKRGQSEGQNFGLGGFQDLLGRLNGKAEVVISKEKEIRADLGRRFYAEQKWGPSRFVRGGYLVGDKIEEEPSTIPRESTVTPDTPLSVAQDVESTIDVEVPQATGALKPDSGNAKAQKSKSKKVGETKAERRQRKLEKRAKKDMAIQPNLAPIADSTSPSHDVSEVPSTTLVKVHQTRVSATNEELQTEKANPIVHPGSRMAVRQRYIKQKRMASMDPQALREILMLKS